MKRILFLTCLALFFLLPFNKALATTNMDFAEAQTVIENWFAAMKNNQIDKAASYLAPQFISIHTDSIVRNRAQEIALIKNLHMKDYQLSDFKFSQSGNIITATYTDTGSEMIDSKSTSGQAAGRMAVLQKQNGKWCILAYANLDKLTQAGTNN